MYGRLAERVLGQDKSLKGKMVVAIDGMYWMYEEVVPGPTLLGALEDPDVTDDMLSSYKVWKTGMFGLVLEERWVKFRGTSYPYLKILSSSGEVGWIYEMWCAEVD